ncbi:flagellar basal body-associated protein FliL [Agromyces hippuratus]|uniref:Flagellar basal body-associated protein FliL n=1 Tax=Agromyces hippuratus TaxID=286438 RepID=A0A852WX00_9MICO|nr:DUF2510 domain-containing protein [Agromyces hippuratus]NYG20463.1 flagellar basal body-associated protein FliL [Agromyces hippuratus]
MTDPNQPPANWYPDPESPEQQRYWDGTQWTEHRSPLQEGGPPTQADAPTAEPPKKKRTALWVTLSVVGGLVLIVIIGASIAAANRGSNAAKAEPTPSIVEETPEAPEPSPEPVPEPVIVPTQTFPGTGDNVIPVSILEPAIIKFECADCTSNTVLETDGYDSLLVNTIGAYSGNHLVNITEGAIITQFTVKGDGNWVITVSDISTVPATAGGATGHGDTVVMLADYFTSAAIANTGESNFVVEGYGGTYPELAVNTIGSYQGTVELTGPGFVQVTSEGDWSITPQ